MIRFDDVLEKASAYIGEKDVPLLQKAYVFAARAHKGQVRRSGEPYLSHPLEVAGMLAEMRLDRTTLVAGLLHDVLEDTDVTAADVRENFGKDVADLVEGVTKITRVHDASTETGRAETLRKIILAMTDDLRTIFIKLADRIHNLKTLKFLPEDKQQRIARETLDIYAPIANRLGMGRIRAELEDLAFRYVAPEEYFRIASLVEPRRKQAGRDLRRFARTLAALLEENGIPVKLESRIKRPYSIWLKTRRRDVGFDQVFDFLAVRLITDSVRNAYAALGIIHQRWSHLPQRFRDFIAMPKPNLYQALHTTVITEEKQTFEVQIRTREMHELAENGIAAHWMYKEGVPQGLAKEDRRLNWLREMAALYEEQKDPRAFLRTLKTNLIPDEVYVFTPKGQVITLPPGATALDFAFKIHSEIGLHAAGARINGAPAALRKPLKTGDIVEIVTAPERRPRRSWLSAAATSDARQHIKRWLSLRSRTSAVELGRRLWLRAVRRLELPAGLGDETALLERLAAAAGTALTSLDDFHRLVGQGRILLDRPFLERAFPGAALDARKETLLEKAVARVKRRPAGPIVVRGPDDPDVTLAQCCSPIRGEPIVGYITGRGITVHARRCARIVGETLDEQRMVEAAWDAAAGGEYRARLLVKVEDAPGALARVAGALADAAINISRAEIRTAADGTARISLEIQIRDIGGLEAGLGRVRALKDVVSAERTDRFTRP